MDVFNSEYMSYVPLSDDELGNAEMGLPTNIGPVSGGALLRISEPLSVGYRTPEGKFVGLFVASKGLTADWIKLALNTLISKHVGLMLLT